MIAQELMAGEVQERLREASALGLERRVRSTAAARTQARRPISDFRLPSIRRHRGLPTRTATT